MPFAVPYHTNAICSPISHECYLQSHITLMLFALQASYSKFCKDDLLMVNWPKHIGKVKGKINTFIVLFDWSLKMFVAFLFTNTTGCPLQEKMNNINNTNNNNNVNAVFFQILWIVVPLSLIAQRRVARPCLELKLLVSRLWNSG